MGRLHWLVLMFIICETSLTQAYPDLRLVQAISRHGSRSPTTPYPTNENQAYYTQGKGQLTLLGMNQMADLGLFLKERYNTFINTSYYFVKESYIQSTDVDRTLMSAECLLSELFIPSDTQMFRRSLRWQPVPIHTEDRMADVKLDMDFPPCPRYNETIRETRESEAYQIQNSLYGDLYEFLINVSGFPSYPPWQPNEAWHVWDTLNCDKSEGLPLPDWATPELMAKISQEVIPFEYEVRYGTTEKTRLKGGPYLYDVTSKMESVAQGDEPMPQFIYSSAHDNNILLLLNALNRENFTFFMVPYSSAIMIELWQMSRDQYSVATLYRNGTDMIQNITIPGCSNPCPLEDFLVFMKPYMLSPDERPEACKAHYQYSQEQPESTQNYIIYTVAIAVSVVSLILIIGIFIACRRGPRIETDMNTSASLPPSSTEQSPLIPRRSVF